MIRRKRQRLFKEQQVTKKIDTAILFVTLGLLLFGVVMVANTSVVDATRFFDDKYFYAKRQLIWALVGLGGLFVCLQIPYSFWKKAALPTFIGVVLLLIAVLIPGIGNSILGARRWISLGSIVIQPAEIGKFALCIFLARLLSVNRSITPFLLVVSIVAGLVVLEPDLGTTVIIVGISIVMYFASGASIKYFLALIPLLILGIVGFILNSPYRRSRFFTFLDPSQDPLGTSYHIRQILIALGSGGLFGVGLGQSRQKYLFLPEPATDSIFAIIGEELGFVGGVSILFAYLFLIWRGLRVAQKVEDPFGKLLAGGIVSWIGIQAFVNLSAMVAIVPLTGVPLPLLSFGGSSLVMVLSGIGVLLNISKYTKNR